MITDDIDHAKWKEALIKFDLVDIDIDDDDTTKNKRECLNLQWMRRSLWRSSGLSFSRTFCC